MSYSTKGIPADGSVNFMDSGIHENVELKGIRYGISPNVGNKFIVFEFEDNRGRRLAHTEYEPKDQDDTRLNQKITNQIKRIKHIAKRYMPEDTFDIEVSDFESFAKKTIELFGIKFVDKKVRIKVTYSNTGYTSLPNYTPFIESMDVPKEESRLEILSIDQMTRERADRETPIANPLDELSQKDDDKLPF